jgi:predicted polyphosphate/ATP-dependent NAD kinase
VVPTLTQAAADPLKTTAIRRSIWNKDKADEHTLHKTSRVAAKKNLEPGTSFTSFSDSHVISNLGRVGFKLGQTDKIVKASSVAIKNLEIDRMVVLADKKKCNLKSNKLLDESDDERDARLEAVLSQACGNLNENLQVLESDHIIDLSPVR